MYTKLRMGARLPFSQMGVYSCCSLIGMFLIIVGLYSFLWAKNEETKATLKTTNNNEEAGKTPAESAAVVVPAPSPPNGTNHGDVEQQEYSRAV